MTTLPKTSLFTIFIGLRNTQPTTNSLHDLPCDLNSSVTSSLCFVFHSKSLKKPPKNSVQCSLKTMKSSSKMSFVSFKVLPSVLSGGCDRRACCIRRHEMPPLLQLTLHNVLSAPYHSAIRDHHLDSLNVPMKRCNRYRSRAHGRTSRTLISVMKSTAPNHRLLVRQQHRKHQVKHDDSQSTGSRRGQFEGRGVVASSSARTCLFLPYQTSP